MMRGFTLDIGMFAGREVETLDGTQPLEDLERPEDGRPADAQATSPGRGHEVRRGEVTVLVGDQHSQRPTRLRQSVAGTVECGDDRSRVAHRPQRTMNETQSHHRARCGWATQPVRFGRGGPRRRLRERPMLTSPSAEGLASMPATNPAVTTEGAIP